MSNNIKPDEDIDPLKKLLRKMENKYKKVDCRIGVKHMRYYEGIKHTLIWMKKEIENIIQKGENDAK